MQHKNSIIPGVILILIGVLILLHKFQVFYLDWGTIYPIVLMVTGLSFFVLIKTRNDKGAVFPGTVFFLIGLFFFLRNNNWLDLYYFDEFWPVFLIIFGLAFLAVFVLKPHDWGVLIPASILLFLGLVFFSNKMGWLSWGTQVTISRLWPVLLILIGVVIILTNLKRTPKNDC